jgi:hypothetical protein
MTFLTFPQRSRATPRPSWHDRAMADTSYRIVHREDDSFAVEIVRVGALPQTAAGFATEAAARNWIAQDERFQATDPFGIPAGRRRGY